MASCSLTLAGNTSVTATFSVVAAQPVLSAALAGTGKGTVTSTPAGINCGSVCSASFGSGTVITLTETPMAGSTFAGWSGACSGMASCSLTLTGNTSVTATFSAPTAQPVLNIGLAGTGMGTVTSIPSGINCGSVCSASFNSGSAVALAETPATDSAFDGWSGACNGTTSCMVTLTGNTSVTATFSAVTSYTLTVTPSGTGAGFITSSPAGINCGSTCTATFPPGTQVTLTGTPSANSYLTDWSGACSGSGSCAFTVSGPEAVGATINLWPISHIIFMAQENRSFDHYFGALREYWAQNGYPDQSYDGLPQFNPTSGSPPLAGPAPTNPGCDPAYPYQPPPAPFQDCVFDSSAPATSYHLITQCVENPSPFWNESHVNWDYYDPTGLSPAASNGFVFTSAHDARDNGYYDSNPFHDTLGLRAIGYYDGGDLNYYYFMASNFGTSDRWFNPVMTRTNANREFLIGATSQGYVYPIGTNSNDQALIAAPPIFQQLQAAGISWKIYVNPTNTGCTGPPYQASFLLGTSYVKDFQWGTSIPTLYPQNIGTIGIPNSDFGNDLANGTLPQVVQIEPASDAGLDEHPADYDTTPSDSQLGANYVSGLISQLMASQYWASSAFILTCAEYGGFMTTFRRSPR